MTKDRRIANVRRFSSGTVQIQISAPTPYTPRFTAKSEAALRWRLPADPCPTHELIMSTLRALPGGDRTLGAARQEAREIDDRIADRNWNRWRDQEARHEG